MSNEPINSGHRKKGRLYAEYENSFFKRTLSSSEYDGEPCLPYWNKERLRNEADCLRFIGCTTNIPVPKVLEAYEKDGSYHLSTQRVPGVSMNKLSENEQAIVMDEVKIHLQTLKGLKSDRIGGPSDIICPPHRAANYSEAVPRWTPRTSASDEFVFCHNDLTLSNIFVDKASLNITGIIGWEFGSYFPDYFEGHFYQSPRIMETRNEGGTDSRKLKAFLEGQSTLGHRIPVA
ncbi:hypothetical protein MMC27_005002 [Xylographa pallens]|nr:hypothetical protein [Xylographa pallens]